MRITLDLGEDVLQAVKELAAQQNRPIGDVVSELIRRALEPAPRPQRVRNGIPLFPHRPGAPPITTEMVNALRDEE